VVLPAAAVTAAAATADDWQLSAFLQAVEVLGAAFPPSPADPLQQGKPAAGAAAKKGHKSKQPTSKGSGK
jgi:hypothetical protein